jgi:hypothetical protein
MKRPLAIVFFVALFVTVALAQTGAPETGRTQTATDANIQLPAPALGSPKPTASIQNGGGLLRLPPLIPPVSRGASQSGQLSIIGFIDWKPARLNDSSREPAQGPEFRIIDGAAYLCYPGLGYCIPMVGGGKSGCVPGDHLNSIIH